MRTPQYSATAIIDLFRQQTVASLPDVMAALGTRARRTAFRKLKELPYRTSYSHRGSYYTLADLIHFDEHGLWSFGDVRFSTAGTLLATAAAMVADAPGGQFSEELDNRLHVGTQDALRTLVRDGKLTRHSLAGRFLVLRRRPHRQGAATERSTRSAGRPWADRTGAGCRPRARGTARRDRAVRQLA